MSLGLDHLSPICLIQLAKQRSIPNTTSSMLTIWFALLPVMNGKEHFEHTMGLLNGVLYLKGSLMLWQPFNALSMTFSLTCSTSRLLFTLMTYLSIQMTRNHIRQTFRKSFADFANTVYFVTHLNVNSIQTLLNTSATSFHRMVSKWHLTKLTLSLNGLHLAKSKTFSLSSVSAISIDNLYSTIQKLLFYLLDLSKKMLCGSGHHNANSLLIHSSKLSLYFWLSSRS